MVLHVHVYLEVFVWVGGFDFFKRKLSWVEVYPVYGRNFSDVNIIIACLIFCVQVWGEVIVLRWIVD